MPKSKPGTHTDPPKKLRALSGKQQQLLNRLTEFDHDPELLEAVVRLLPPYATEEFIDKYCDTRIRIVHGKDGDK